MAGHPIHRRQSNTDASLLKLATEVPLFPPKDRAVFYADDFGARLAASFMKKNSGFTRLDELFESDAIGAGPLVDTDVGWNALEQDSGSMVGIILAARQGRRGYGKRFRPHAFRSK